MELQLTRTKTITIGGGPKAPKNRPVRDVVGIDLFSGDPRGCPAVRLTQKKDGLRIVAAGFVTPPFDDLPDSWESAARRCSWSLPAQFQAPTAALAVNSPAMFFAQATPEAFRADLAAGGHQDETRSPRVGRLGVIRPAAKSTPKPAESTAVPTAEPGIPLSNGGTRFVMRPMTGSQGFVLEAGLPEYQLLWLSRLLPEGHRPTASSIQVVSSARAAALINSAALTEAKGTALAIFLGENGLQIAGYAKGSLVLWRDCPSRLGWKTLRQQVRENLGVADDMVEGVLDDTLIDPRPALEQALEPILRELAVSRDYLAGKLNVEPHRVIVVGVRSGIAYWRDLVRDRLGLELVVPTFEGLDEADPSLFLGALGAALARASEETGEGTRQLHLNLLAESERVSSNPIRLRVMLPIFAFLAGLGILIWWTILLGRLLMVNAQTNTLKEELARNETAHKATLARLEEALEGEAELAQLEGYRLSRNLWGQTLCSLAEVMPLKIQLTKLEIPEPPPQTLVPPGWRGPLPWGPTNRVDEVRLVLAGRTPKETPVISLMESLESETFTNSLIIAKGPQEPQPSPRVKSFRQEATLRDGSRPLAFEIEYRARERRFAP